MNSVRRIFDGSRVGQKIVANIYTPLSPSKAAKQFTLILTHANGFHKELWEPTLERLFKSPHSSWTIAQAIALDGYNHGDSAIMNRNSIMDETESPWFLNARDILSVIEQVKAQIHVQNIIGIGHSWGASSLLLTEIMFPSTFRGLIITDPVLFQTSVKNSKLREMTLKRRCKWSSKEDARNYFEPHTFFKTWDKRILDLHIRYGLENIASKWMLKCRPINEAAVFAGAFEASPYATNNLSHVKCPTLFLTGELSLPSPPDYIKLITKDMSDCQHVVMDGKGHLLLHEDPDRTADCYLQFLHKLASKIPGSDANL
ncbi:hypothetical protein IWW36_003602 [Coemansia brasiliensis]|uniref:AB hydrolase-1 domain-containing protein n=1 Tax=Coemansia brasiliensis TaxID=2650707 RepID=A0A9W8I549_9FUNG|nr:hypothetical protein IWW36_003602 [Coemansia brasiliensis]